MHFVNDADFQAIDRSDDPALAVPGRGRRSGGQSAGTNAVADGASGSERDRGDGRGVIRR